MIYTITFNPSIDYFINLENMEIGKVNYVKTQDINSGGKGINVSIVLNNLGKKSTAMGFIGGFTGQYIKNSLINYGIDCDFIEINGMTRINIKINNEETSLNGLNPLIDKNSMDLFIEKISRIKGEDLVAICGSVPSSISYDKYENILEILSGNNVDFIVDTTKLYLKKSLKYRPLLIKPNKAELEELFNVKIDSYEDLVKYGKELVYEGARNVIISLGGNGAIFINNEMIIKLDAPRGKVINTVGAGDSLVAGFIDEYLNSYNLKKAFYRGVCTGSASSFSSKLATKEEVELIYKNFIGGIYENN